jgi:hypothetical protein
VSARDGAGAGDVAFDGNGDVGVAMIAKPLDPDRTGLRGFT